MKLPTVKMLPIALVLSTLTHSAFAQQFDEIQKQLAVISNIVKTTASQNLDKKGPQITGIESLYLEGQGVVLTVHSSTTNLWGSFATDFASTFEYAKEFASSFDFSMPPVPPVPPVAPAPRAEIAGSSYGDYTSEHIAEKVERAVEEASRAYEHAMENYRENHEDARTLRERERELAYELRDIERELRNIDLQRVNSDDKKELETHLVELKKRRAELVAEQDKVKVQNNAFKAKRDEFAKQQREQETAYFIALEKEIVNSLCLYGNGLKALSNKENISVVFKQAGETKGNRKRDKIIVLSKTLIKQCVVDDIKSSELLAKAKRYEF